MRVEIKEQFGSVIPESTTESSVVELPAREGQAQREASRWKINQVLQARAQQLFALVRRELARVGMEHSLTGGLVLTGGGALLHGWWKWRSRNWDVRRGAGLPRGIVDWPDELNDPSWTTAAGLAKYSARLRTQVDLERQSIGLLGRILQ